MEEWLVTGLGQKMYMKSLQYLVIPASGEAMKDHQGPVSRTQEPTEEAPTAKDGTICISIRIRIA